MILLCPHCAERSVVDKKQAEQPRAEVHCGSCEKSFYVSAAHAEAEAVAPKPFQGRASARPRMWAKVMLTGMGALGLALLCFKDVRKMQSSAQLLRAEVRVAAAQGDGEGQGLALLGVRVEPYAEKGGAEGLLILGEVVNTGPVSRPFVPRVEAHAAHPALPRPVLALLAAGPKMTLLQAKDLVAFDEAAPRPAPILLGAGEKVPFLGLVAVPPTQTDAPWEVLVTWSRPAKAATEAGQAG